MIIKIKLKEIIQYFCCVLALFYLFMSSSLGGHELVQQEFHYFWK